MTHTIHRAVPKTAGDYVLNIRSAKGINREGSGDKIRELVRRLMPLGLISFGNPKDGCTLRASADEVLARFHDGSNLHAVFSDREKFLQALAVIREMDTGLSVALSCAGSEMDRIAAALDINIDSVHFTAGVLNAPAWDPGVAEMVSLCGHMRISPLLVEYLADRVAGGSMDTGEAAARIGRVCRCGCFNTVAAEEILARMAGDAPD